MFLAFSISLAMAFGRIPNRDDQTKLACALAGIFCIWSVMHLLA